MMGCIEVGAPGRPDVVFFEVADQSPHTDAADLLVITQRIMKRGIEPVVVQRSDESRGLGESDADEALHIR